MKQIPANIQTLKAVVMLPGLLQQIPLGIIKQRKSSAFYSEITG
jgi:hypothetical protein